jgi:hypothetical protein
VGREDKLCDLAIAYWDLQQGNYDIELNYPELLNFNFKDPQVDKKIEDLLIRSKEILESEKPLPPPEVDNIFRKDIAPVPNNIVLNVVARAIMAGGEDFALKTMGWQAQGEHFVFEDEFEKAGTITVAIEDCRDQVMFLKSLNPFTLDVFMAAIGHLCHASSKSKIDKPLSMKAILTARQILAYKNLKAFGKKRWDMFEHINEELEKLNKIKIRVQNAQSSNTQNKQKEPVNYEGSLIIVSKIKREFNSHTKCYVATSWKIKLGIWAVYTMSKKRDMFIGKLSRVILRYDHREQRSNQAFAKKLMIALFVLPGGTHYIKCGANKSLGEYLKLIGECHEDKDEWRNRGHRSLKRLVNAIDLLVDGGMITTNISGSVFDYIKKLTKKYDVRDVLNTTVELKMVTGV